MLFKNFVPQSLTCATRRGMDRGSWESESLVRFRLAVRSREGGKAAALANLIDGSVVGMRRQRERERDSAHAPHLSFWVKTTERPRRASRETKETARQVRAFVRHIVWLLCGRREQRCCRTRGVLRSGSTRNAPAGWAVAQVNGMRCFPTSKEGFLPALLFFFFSYLAWALGLI